MSTATISAPGSPSPIQPTAPGPPSPAQLKKQPPAAADFGTMLKAWRRTRHVSQLDLSSASGVSTRHLSFMETGRAKPSRDMVLRLADELEVPLRDRNKLLVAAGYAPEFKARALGSPEMASVRRAIDVVLTGHLPYPALMHDQRSNIIEANKSVGIFTDLVAPHLLEGGGNTVRLTLHPEGLAPHLVNHGEARDRMLRALSRRAAASGDPELTALLRECVAYPHPDPEPEPDLYARRRRCRSASGATAGC